MAYIDRKVINDDILPEIQRDSINKAFNYLETCKQAPTSIENEQLQQEYFDNFKYEISALDKKIKGYKNKVKTLKRLERTMKKRFREVKTLNSRSVEELSYGKPDISKPRSRSRSRSRDREEEEIEKKAMKLFAIEREMYDEEKKIYKIPNTERHWNRLPPDVKNKYIKMVNTSKGGRTRKNKK